LAFDLAEGNAELRGVNEDLYIYAGLITKLSKNGQDWKYIVGEWLDNSKSNKLKRIAADKYIFECNPNKYFKATGDDVVGIVLLVRNSDGSKVLRNVDGTDIFIPLYPKNKIAVRFTKPEYPLKALRASYNIGESVEIEVASNLSADIKLYANGDLAESQDNTQRLNHSLRFNDLGEYHVLAKAQHGGQTISQEITFFVSGEVVVEALPSNVSHNGVTVNRSKGEVTFTLTAPQKENVYLLGDFNDFKMNPTYAMKRTPDGKTYWLTLSELDFSKDYLYQFLIDSTTKVADPYATLILDPQHDNQMGRSISYLPNYPLTYTDGIVSVLDCNPSSYSWTNNNFTKPHPLDLVIYELLVRDFSVGHDYATVRDSIDYFKRLGVNAIQFMPLQESEGNSTWGYNPSFHMALDKYYGRAEDLKDLIDKLHGQGIAVILDVVLNHAFGQSPMVQMYVDQGAPSATNPWFNRTATHPFNVGFDFNHESALTQTFVKDVLRYWLTEFKIDGFRFDLSKGFTQKNSGTSESQVGQWSAYDPGRVALWKDYNAYVKTLSPDCYVILEHFADDQEERELANEGMLLWNNLNAKFNETTMGYHSGDNSDLIRLFKESRNFSAPNFISYMESHDEERVQFKNAAYGNNGSGNYSVKDLQTAMQRTEAAVAFLMGSPGPKMIWQFGEFGYDVSIDHNGRTGEKPLRWNYLEEASRKSLFDQYARLIRFKKANMIFRDADLLEYSLKNGMKYFVLSAGNQKVMILANFDVVDRQFTVGNLTAGTWYDNITDGIVQWNEGECLMIEPGAYCVLSKTKLNN
jgi:1,4-alpha-glucan branching enzyme